MKLANTRSYLVYTAEDANLAAKHGFDGIIISNHGGRQLDGVPSTLDALREIAPIVKGKIPIAIDGGIRRGTDIFKALALGADFCLAGRPAIWGLAVSFDRNLLPFAIIKCRCSKTMEYSMMVRKALSWLLICFMMNSSFAWRSLGKSTWFILLHVMSG